MDIAKMYAAVGRALSSWELYESELASLFAGAIAGQSAPMTVKAAHRAFCANRTHEGRIEMLKAAVEAIFEGSDFTGHSALNRIMKFLNDSTSWASRRNEIAHGRVVRFWSNEGITMGGTVEPKGFMLCPTKASAKWNTVDGVPLYAYGTKELEYFGYWFDEMGSVINQFGLILQNMTTVRNKS